MQDSVELHRRALAGLRFLKPTVVLLIFELTAYYFYRLDFASERRLLPLLSLPVSLLIAVAWKFRRLGRWWLLSASLPMALLAASAAGLDLRTGLAAWGADLIAAIATITLLESAHVAPGRYEGQRDLVAYGLVAVLIAPLLGATAGALLIYRFDQDTWRYWRDVFRALALANLIVTPIFLTWSSPAALSRLSKWGSFRLLEAGVALAAFCISADQLVGVHLLSLLPSDWASYALLASLTWTALSFGMDGATAGVGCLCAFAIYAAIVRQGPFAGHPPTMAYAGAQVFIAGIAAVLYIGAALIEGARQSRAQLLESRSRFSRLADIAPVLIWMSGADSKLEFVNKTWLNFTGQSLERTLGTGWLQSLHDADRAEFVSQYEAHFIRREPFELEARLKRCDGAYRSLLWRGEPLYSPEGRYVGFTGSASDVTDLREQQAALCESERRYREVVQSQSEFVCRCLPDTVLTFANEAYCNFLGRSSESLLGEKLTALLPESAEDSIRHSFVSAMRSDKASSWECEMTAPDGRIVAQNWVCSAVRKPDGTCVEFQVIGRDISDRRYAEEAERKLMRAMRLATIGELTAIMTHEITQPLSAILGNAEAADILLSAPKPPIGELREINRDIRTVVLRSREAVRRIRGLAQRRNPELSPIDLNDTVAAVMRLLAGEAGRRRVRLRMELGKDMPLVSADRPSIEQVLVNLIINGMDAMSEIPSAARELMVWTRANSAEELEVIVVDRGHGIPPDRMERLFDSFFTTKEEGMGLGLSIASSIIDAHSGRLWAQNDPDGGAAFHFTLRVVDDGAGLDAPDQDPAEADAARQIPAI